MRFDLGTLDSGERSLPFALLVFNYVTRQRSIRVEKSSVDNLETLKPFDLNVLRTSLEFLLAKRGFYL